MLEIIFCSLKIVASVLPVTYLSACWTHCKLDITKRTSSALSNLVMVILLGANIRTRAVCSVNTW